LAREKKKVKKKKENREICLENLKVRTYNGLAREKKK
jgi:hypothetical protein